MTLPFLTSREPLRAVGWLTAALSLHLGLLLSLRSNQPDHSTAAAIQSPNLLVEVQLDARLKEVPSSMDQELTAPLEPVKKNRSSSDRPRKAELRRELSTPRPESGGPELLTTAADEQAQETTVTGQVGSLDGEAGGVSGEISESKGNGRSPTERGTSIRKSPRLLARSMQCADLYPYQAHVDHALVAAEVLVSPTGHTELNRILKSSASEPGFSMAARLCAKRLLFAPARDAGGRATQSVAVVRMTFERT